MATQKTYPNWKSLKTYALTKNTHLFTTIPNPPENTLNDIERNILQFMWDGKPIKIKKRYLTTKHYKWWSKPTKHNTNIKRQ